MDDLVKPPIKTLLFGKTELKSKRGEPMADSLEIELQKMYHSEFAIEISWIFDGGIDLSINDDDVTGNVRTVSEILPWLQNAIAEHYPDSKYHVERMGGVFEPAWVEPPESLRTRIALVNRRGSTAFGNTDDGLIARVFMLEKTRALLAVSPMALV